MGLLINNKFRVHWIMSKFLLLTIKRKVGKKSHTWQRVFLWNMDVFSNTHSRDGHESPVTFKGSLLVLSQLTSCGLIGDSSSFCSPQQLTRAISGHKGYCQHLTHCLSSWTRPCTKEPWGTRAGLGAARRWPPKAVKGSPTAARLWCRAEESSQPDIPRVSHYPAVYHHQLATTGVQNDLPHPPHPPSH